MPIGTRALRDKKKTLRDKVPQQQKALREKGSKGHEKALRHKGPKGQEEALRDKGPKGLEKALWEGPKGQEKA